MNTDTPMPEVVDRAAFQTELDALRVREKAHTREGDAIAAARRRLPMAEVDAATPLIGPDGPVTLLDTFEGRRQLVAYYQMWHTGRPAAEQCDGCTYYNGQIRELSSLWTNGRGVEAMDIAYALMDMTVYGRQETWEDAPAGWPRDGSVNNGFFSTGGRPTAQWPRLKAGYSDDLGTPAR